MPQVSLSVPHHKQTQEADCLAACVAMVLEFIGKPMRYDRILKMLDTTSYGTVASHVTRLTKRGLHVTYAEGALVDLQTNLQRDFPVITLVRTGELPYWPDDTMHAILLVGYNDTYFYANDPNFEDVPIDIPMGDFDLAWLEMGSRYIVISTD